MARNKKKDKDAGGGSASWMVTFSDLSTLLLTFFVLLLSMSSMDKIKLQSMFQNFSNSSGVLLFKEYGEIYKPKEILIEGLYEKLKDNLVINKEQEEDTELVSDITENPFEDVSGILEFQPIESGFKLVFGQGVLFESGSAELKPEGREVLDQVANFIRISNYQVYVDGHTDNLPINTPEYPSNYHLSLARAYNVFSYLVKRTGASGGAIAMAGYGPDKPRAPNVTESGRARNRRVEIIFKNQKYF